MINYDKLEIREQLSLANIFELLDEFNGEPEYTSFGIISRTICHNDLLSDASRKLYFYENTGLFRCYTGCDEPVFDPFELVIKVMKLQHHQDFDLNDAVRWVAQYFGIAGQHIDNDEITNNSEDWKVLNRYDKIKDTELKIQDLVLKDYDSIILSRFNYNLQITPWLNEGITQDVLDTMEIGFYPGGDQITIPHYDRDNRFIGLRGRTVVEEDGERYGKYRPIKVNQMLYNHPLGMNLYNLNNAQDNIALMGKAIVFEGEKSVLLYKSYFGIENDISVACCGSNLTNYQTQLLLEAGAKEIIVAFDRQFKEIGDKEFLHLKNNLLKLYEKNHNRVKISFIFDKNMITNYKASPIDEGKEKFLKLFQERIVL